MQGEAVLQASLNTYQAMAAAVKPTEMAKVLMQLEELLGKAGLMRRSWAEHWQHSWQRAVSYCVDWKHALLLTSTLQVSSSPPGSGGELEYGCSAYKLQCMHMPCALLSYGRRE